MSILGKLSSKSSDWGTLERFISWAWGGGASASGILVTPNTAMQSAAVYSCVQVLAQSVGMLPLNLFEESAGSKRLALEHPLFELLHHQPNDWQTSVEFLEMIVASLCLRGNAYAYVNRARSGRIVELLPIHPDVVRTEMSADFKLTYSISLPDGTFKQYQPGEIFHVRGLTLNGWLGISPIAYARESIGLALATEKFGGQLFKNGAKMGGVLEHPGKVGEEAYKRLKNSFDEATSGENAHKTALLEEGMKFNKISMNADDSQFLETRQYQRSEIAAIFRVPPHMIGDLSRATFSNIEQQSLDFINSALSPWLNRIEKAIRRDLFSADDKKRLRVRFNVASLLRGDQAARAAYYNSGITAGWMTRNEPRSMESDLGIIMNPLEGLDVPLMPLNMTDGSDDPDEADDLAEESAQKSVRIANLEQKLLEKPAPAAPAVHITLNQEPVNVKIAPAAVTMHAPAAVKSDPPHVQVDVHVPQGAAPVVNNTVNVPPGPAPTVNNTVNVEKQDPSPVILEATLPALTVNAVLPARKTKTETAIKRDAAGGIIGSTSDATETDA